MLRKPIEIDIKEVDLYENELEEIRRKNNKLRRIIFYKSRPTPFLERGGPHRSIMCIVFVLLVTIVNTVSFNNRLQRYDNIVMLAILFYMDFLMGSIKKVNFFVLLSTFRIFAP